VRDHVSSVNENQSAAKGGRGKDQISINSPDLNRGKRDLLKIDSAQLRIFMMGKFNFFWAGPSVPVSLKGKLCGYPSLSTNRNNRDRVKLNQNSIHLEKKSGEKTWSFTLGVGRVWLSTCHLCGRLCYIRLTPIKGGVQERRLSLKVIFLGVKRYAQPIPGGGKGNRKRKHASTLLEKRGVVKLVPSEKSKASTCGYA